MRIKISHARVIDPVQALDSTQTIVIEDGQLLPLTHTTENLACDTEIDAEGMWLLPGFVDTAARYGEPGYTEKGTIASETYAAARGGLTHVCCYPDTQPCIDSPVLAKQIIRQSKQSGFVATHPMGALTIDLQGRQLADTYALSKAGCPVFTNAQARMPSPLILRQCYDWLQTCQQMVVIRAEEPSLYQGTCAHEGPVSSRLGLPSTPAQAESIAVATHLELIALTQVKAHFSCITAQRSVALIRQAKADGLPVTCDVSMTHLHLTDRDITEFNALFHLRPPLRTPEDKAALLAGLCDGTIDAICSDHQPHETTAKLAPFGDSTPGASTLDTCASLGLHLVNEKLLPLPILLKAMSYRPAEIFGLPYHGLTVGAPVDITLIDPRHTWTVSPETLLSKGKNSPFIGWMLPGRVQTTFFNGKQSAL